MALDQTDELSEQISRRCNRCRRAYGGVRVRVFFFGDFFSATAGLAGRSLQSRRADDRTGRAMGGRHFTIPR